MANETKKPSWLKKNIKMVLICLFALLWVNSCTKSCSKEKIINRQAIEIAMMTGTVDSLNTAIDAKDSDIAWMEKNKKDITAVANGNQASYIEEITRLNKEKASLINKLKSLEKELKAVRTENDELKKRMGSEE